MDLGKLRLPAVVALICIASFVTFLQVKANQDTDDPVGSAAVWTPDSDDLSEIAQACNAASDYGKCFLDQMENYASSEAVEFSQSLLEQSPFHTGYLKELREAGAVDLGLVAYPRSQGTGEGWVLLNGTPEIVNAEDLNRLPQPAMEKDPQFAALRKSHPRIALSAGAGGNAAPEILNLENGGQRFVIGYLLQENCPACRPVARASFGFDFDVTGKFLGAKFLKVSVL